jgi:restriction endonuclease Mrr
MIEHCVGVMTSRIYEMKRIGENYFSGTDP